MKNTYKPGAADEQQARPYNSPARQQQADATQRRILDAAQALLAEHGYAKMTVAAIAKKAGVSTPTVYATFRSKRGILAELLDRQFLTPALHDLRQAAIEAKEPLQKLRHVASLSRLVNEASLPPGLDRIDGAAVIDPDLHSIIEKRERDRRKHQEPLMQELKNSGCLRDDLSFEELQDTFWVLTALPPYYMLRRRGWSEHEYESWLYAMLVSVLLRQSSR